MAVAHYPIPASLDISGFMTVLPGPTVKIQIQKDGRQVGLLAKRIGSHSPKKDRNR